MAFALRVVALDLESLWFDTAHSAVLASNASLDAVLRGAAADFQSPLYFVLLHWWLAVAHNDFWLAFPSVAAGVLTVPLAYATGRRLFSAPAGLGAALVCALTTYQVYYSRYPRGYMLLAFLALLAAYWLHRALAPAEGASSRMGRFGQAPAWAAHGAAVTAAVYTQPYAFFIVAAMWGAGGLYALAKRPAALPPLMVTAALVGVAYLPWLGSTWSQVTGVRAGADAWIEPVSGDSLKTLWDWLWFKTRGEYGLLVDATLRGGRYLLTALMLLAAWRLRARFGMLYTAALTAGPVALAFAFSAAVVSLWDARYLVSVSPFFALWLGAALADAGPALRALRLPPTTAGSLAGASLGLLLAMSPAPLYSLYADPAFRSAELRDALALVHGQYRPGDTIVHINYQSYLPALWYGQLAAAGGDGPHAVPCVWESLPREWCAAAPYREAYVNPALMPFDVGVRDVERGWVLVLYNHNKLGDGEAQLGGARRLLTPLFTVSDTYQFTGVYALHVQRRTP